MLSSYPLVTVIIPIYNVEDYLDKCLESVVSQTYSNLEIVLINDGSTDGSNDIIKRWRKKDQRIVAIYQKNQGLSAARNTGLNIAKGDWIAFVDSDDFVSENYIQEMIQAAVDNTADLVICQINKTIGNSISSVTSSQKGIYNSQEFWKLFFEKKSDDALVVAWNKLYSKEIFNNLRYKRGIINEDEQILYSVIKKCKKIIILPQALYFYRLGREDSIMTKVNKTTAIRKKYYRILLERADNFYKNDQLTYAMFTYKEIMAKLTGELSANYSVDNERTFWYLFCNIKNRIKKQNIKSDFTLKIYLHFPRMVYLIKLLKKKYLTNS